MKQIENQRLFDLVRYQRGELHEAGLITDDEYAWLAAGVDGSQPARRLEDYDANIERIKTLEKYATAVSQYVSNEQTYGGTHKELSERAEKAERERDEALEANRRANLLIGSTSDELQVIIGNLKS